jgi:hypothetical protein
LPFRNAVGIQNSGGAGSENLGAAPMPELIRNAADWAGFFRTRIAALGLSHFEVDQLAGLADGYTNKLCNGKKLPGAATIERVCRELKISLRPVADGETENCALEDCDKPQQRSDTPDDQRSDLHVETGTGCSPVGAGIAGEAAGEGGPGQATAGRADPKDTPRRDRGAADRGRGMNEVLERPTTIQWHPPAPRAPSVLEQRPALEREMVDLKQRIAETVLAAFEGKPNARENLAALDAKIRAVSFQLDGNAAAHELAERLDREAVAAWRAAIEDADPAEVVGGITRRECCEMCSDAQGCVITGLQCGHPVKVGTVGPRLMSNPKVRALFRAAAETLGVIR